MFAVKGWAVDSSVLKAQTEPFKAAAAPDQNGNGENKLSRKRKREDAAASVKSADVSQLWDKHIEGREPSKAKKQAKKERKRQKTEPDTDGSNPNEHDTTAKSGKDALGHDEPPDAGSKAAKKKKKDKTKKDVLEEKPSKAASNSKADINTPKPTLPSTSKLTPMQAAMRQKLVSARFRHLNQTLYTEPSAKALALFNQNPDMFEDYHSGFRQQVSVWPENPVDNFIATIRARGSIRLLSQKKAFKDKKKQPSETAPDLLPQPNGIVALPRTHGTCTLADLGCGDARLAHTLKTSNDLQNLHLKVLSYDLHSPSSLVTKADISALPTPDASVDVALFCLALMGTNWIAFIEEAYRILHWKGELWVAEIKSRFGRVGRAGKPVAHSVGGKRKQAAVQKVKEAKRKEEEEGDEQDALAVEVDGVEGKGEKTDVSAFVDVLKRRGFVLKNGDASVDLGNKMFVKMEFIKALAPTKGKGVPSEQDAQRAAPKFKTKKFLEEKEDEVASEDEAKVLKPCLYKIR